MNNRFLIFLASIVIASIVTSCSHFEQDAYIPKNGHVITGDLVTAGYGIADSLIVGLNKSISKKDPIIVTTFSNIDDLDTSTTFGRMLSEQISSRFSQRGFIVREMKFRQNSIYISKDNGEFVLSRDVSTLSKEYNSSAVVVGTYGESAQGAYVSARIIDPSNSTIISSCDYGIRLGMQKGILFSRK